MGVAGHQLAMLGLFVPTTGDAPALCDLVCACILEQLRLLDTVKEKPDYSDIVKPYPKVCGWE